MGAWPDRARQGDELADLRCGVIGGAPIPDLAALHQRVHRADDLLGRCFGIGLVEQVEIEVVGTEPTEAILGLPEEEVACEFRRPQVVACRVREGGTAGLWCRSRRGHGGRVSPGRAAASAPPQP